MLVMIRDDEKYERHFSSVILTILVFSSISLLWSPPSRITTIAFARHRQTLIPPKPGCLLKSQ